jgi:V/A-type H+-transporting ATPase subunit I
MIKNNSTINIIKPVFSFLGTVPGYREVDISAPFLIFFSIFVGMILGDAAYGTMFFVIALIAGLAAKIKTGKMPDMLKLLMLLTFCTIIWGAINGSWFAIPVEHLPPFLTMFILPPFNNTSDFISFPDFLQKYFSLPAAIPKEAKSTWSIQFLCFSIAAIHLCFARITSFIKTLPKLSAFSQIGYMMVLLGLYFLILNMLLGLTLQPFVVPMIAIGIGMNFIFSEQNGGNFFKNILKSFSNAISLILKAIGIFADIISYICLFAVGLAGSIIAETFNGMAIPADGFGSIGVGFFLKLLAAVLVLALGHGLNLILATLSVIVHAVRLNLLEFAGNHLGIEWSGYEYKPFALKQKK